MARCRREPNAMVPCAPTRPRLLLTVRWGKERTGPRALPTAIVRATGAVDRAFAQAWRDPRRAWATSTTRPGDLSGRRRNSDSAKDPTFRTNDTFWKHPKSPVTR